jgi:anti-sigma regulatory factor (Ser/Thr protein kinase)
MSAPTTLRPSTTFVVDGGLGAPAAARRLLLEHCAWGSRRSCDEAALMLGELVANAVIHGGMGIGHQIRIEVETRARSLTLRVYDAGPGFIPAAPDEPAPSGGLGLVIIDRLARCWGVVRHDDANCVWCELAVA